MRDSAEKNAGNQARRINWGALIVGTLFTAFSLYISYAIYWSHQQQLDAANHFEPVLATILNSQLAQHNHRDATTGGPVRSYSPHILYRYDVNGQIYESRRFSYLGPVNRGRADVERIVARYPAGSKQTAYYNPDNPAESVLHKNMTQIDLFSGYFWVPLILVVAGVTVILAAWRGWFGDLRN
jgi:hypothetical protein